MSTQSRFPIWPTMDEDPVDLDLRRTRDALDAFDASDEDWRDDGPLGRAVGVAFGLDTADRNDPEVCAALIRPGPRGVRPGNSDVSFVRRMVRKYGGGR